MVYCSEKMYIATKMLNPVEPFLYNKSGAMEAFYA